MRIRSTLARAFAGAVVALAAGGALALAAGTAAQAKGEYHYWNSSSNTLNVSGYGSNAKGYGQWRIADSGSGTRSFFDARLWYYNADNHKKYAYFETWTSSGYCLQPDYTSCIAQFYYYACAETSHSNTADWQWLYANTGLSPSANSAKANYIQVCLDIPLRTDVCSGLASTTGSNY